jgi:hypothetical protein
MKVRLWIPDKTSIVLEDIKSIQQVDQDVMITTEFGKKYYVKNDYYTRIFEDADTLGYIKSVAENLD